MASLNTRDTPFRRNMRCMLICTMMSLANAQYGYDTATIAAFQAMVGFLEVFGYRDATLKAGWGIDPTAQQLITSFLNIGAMIGVLFTTHFSKWKYGGRREGIWVGTVIAFVGVAVQLGTDKIAAVVVGRALVGIANAFYITFANAYISEVAPRHLRGVFGGVFGIMPAIGSTIGTVTVYFSKSVEGRLCYQIPLACLFFFPAVLAVAVFFIPESPRWLLVKGRPQEAEIALRTLRGGSLSEELLQEEFVEMVNGIELEKATAVGATWREVFEGPNLRRTIITVGVYCSRVASGLWVFIAYGTYFFQQAGVADPFAMSMYNFAAGVAGTVFAIWCSYQYLGRRPMVLFGTVGAIISMFAAALGGTIAPGSPGAAKNFMAWNVIYSVVYGGFAATIAWPITAEIPSSRLRVLTLSIATGIDYVLAWLTSFCSPYFINPKALNWGMKYCWLWAGSNVVALVFFYYWLPEVKGRSLEEIDELFIKKVSVRDFAKYECECTKQAHEIVTQKKSEAVVMQTEVGNEKD
ncbi:MFS transporter [Lasiosphaeris hirsuta]|uniref:MFS transporter n=1 Tax=Lasiosphaeris hirsuta TaxID=260670 RepID=A0AA40AS48_9PEZI|nr:MFS transporter [Lasiosphaeris hirsuta]